jgi:hypothetical protein
MAFWCVRSFPKCAWFLGLREVGEREREGSQGSCRLADAGTYDWVSRSVTVLTKETAEQRLGKRQAWICELEAWNWKLGSAQCPLGNLLARLAAEAAFCTALRKYSAYVQEGWSWVGRGLFRARPWP